ncbi:MAG TPA: DUF2283 domain-containing protein [Bryobacteraceae bacterium]|jgi:uncharacterized protein YuzE
MNEEESEPLKPIVFTRHALNRCRERGTTEADVVAAIRGGSRERAERGLWSFRMNVEYQQEWAGVWYGVQQVAPIVDEQADRFVVVTTPTFFRTVGEMQISYDKEADALYIRLLDGEFQCRTVRVTDDIALDFASGERLIGIEVLGASRLFKNPESPLVELRHLSPQIAA